MDKVITIDSSPITALSISDDGASYSTQSTKTTTLKGSHSRIVNSATKPTSNPSQRRQRQTSTTKEPITTLLSSSQSNKTTTNASRVVVNTPDTTQFALHTLKEYAEFSNVFTNPKAKTNVQHFHAYIKDLGVFVNTKNTPMREMSTKKLTKIEDTTTIRKTFGVDIGIQIVNAVRDIILLLIPQIVSKYRF
jgi:hypothetical protein